jgi:Pyridoxamine 5'-phosphate oxidase
MSPGADLRDAFEEIVRGNQYMVLATADEQGVPWATPVWFATEDLDEFLWVSRPGARHSTNLAVRPELALTVFDSRQPAGTGRGVYLSAIGALVPEHDLDRAVAVFSDASERAGAGAWSRSDVTGDARHRIYHAAAIERFVLSDRDERIRVPRLDR